MSVYWSFRRSRLRWELVQTDYKDTVLCVPGYESDHLIDILRACWYLNSNSSSGLDARTMEILDTFR